MQKIELRAHLIELRNRFMIVALFVVIGSVLAIIFQSEVISALLKPMDGESLIYTSPYGGFEFIFKVILFLGFIFAIPVALYQIFKFIAPALPEEIDGLGTKIIIISSLLALAGVSFAYFVAIPASLQFLNSIGGEFLDSFISTNEYLSFFMVYLLGFAVIFQLPLIMSIIDKNHPLQPKTLIKKQKYIIAGSYLVAALMTPTPDAMNQTIMALPIVALYQVGIGVIWTQRKGAGVPDELTELETNWHATTANQVSTSADNLFDLEEEKNRYNDRRKQRTAKKRPKMVSDMVFVPTPPQTKLNQPIQRKITVALTDEPDLASIENVTKLESVRPTKLPLSYEEHAKRVKPRVNAMLLGNKAGVHEPVIEVNEVNMQKNESEVISAELNSKPHTKKRLERTSYIDVVIKNRAQNLVRV